MTNIIEVLSRLAELQTETSPIQLTIGGTSETGVVQHDMLTVHSAAPKVVTAIVNEFEFVSVTSRGLHIPVSPWSDKLPDKSAKEAVKLVPKGQ